MVRENYFRPAAAAFPCSLVAASRKSAAIFVPGLSVSFIIQSSALCRRAATPVRTRSTASHSFFNDGRVESVPTRDKTRGRRAPPVFWCVPTRPSPLSECPKVLADGHRTPVGERPKTDSRKALLSISPVTGEGNPIQAMAIPVHISQWPANKSWGCRKPEWLRKCRPRVPNRSR